MADLEKLSEDHPYCESVKVLLAIAAKTDSPKRYSEFVTMAAFYATDRSILRGFLEDKQQPIQKQRSATTKSKLKGKHPQKSIAKERIPILAKKHVKNADELRAEVLLNLETLIKNKEAFENWMQSGAKKSSKLRSSKSAKSTTANKTSTKKPASAKSGSISKTTKKKRISQKELIDHFIDEAPSITPSTSNDIEPHDLSKTSVEFKEDLVSENLADILAKQGKVKRAIDIYKKLIWKFPQKKSFFADRIENLKK